MIVRELIALFGIEIDAKSVKKVDDAVDKVGKRVKKVGKETDTTIKRFEKGVANVGRLVAGSIFVAGFARAATAVVGFASDAEETLNLVRETFGENASDVEAWSARVAKELGRSEFLMREMAGTLGAVLNPMMDGNTQAAAEMSTGLAELAVDLASFFNAAESDVLVALRAGIIGEAEPMRRFGVVLLESTLQAFALAQGITKTVKSMTIAEKTTLRYNFILSQTVNAQGDAARTADAFANSARAASDAIKDLATRIGNRLLPVATRFVRWVRDATRGMVEVSQKTNILEATLLTLAAALAVVAIMMLAPFLPFLITAAKVVVAIGAITLAVDELITFFTGGKTVIAEFIDELLGIGAAQDFLDNLNAGWKEMHGWWVKLTSIGENLGATIFDFFGGKPPDFGAPPTTRGARAVGPGIGSAVVTARKGSTGRDLRLKRARELEEKRRLTQSDRRNLVRLEGKDPDQLSKREQRKLSDLQTKRSTGGRLEREQLTRRERLELSRITDKVEQPRRETAAERRQREGRVRALGAGASSSTVRGLREFGEGATAFRGEEARRRREEARKKREDAGFQRREEARQRAAIVPLGFGAQGREDVAAQRRERRTDASFRAQQEFARAPATGVSNVTSSTIRIEPHITINEATNPEAVERAVQRGINNAVADASAATARGVR